MIEVSKTKIIIKEAILMNTIIHEIIEKITRDFNNNIEDLMLNSKDISRFIINTKKSLDEIGAMIVKEALEMLDEIIRESSSRKKEYYIQRRNDEKTLITIFGEVNYLRTYYKSKKDGSKAQYTQIRARCGHYPDMFEALPGNIIRLKQS